MNESGPSYEVNIDNSDQNKDKLDQTLDANTLQLLKELFPDKVDEIFKISQEELSQLQESIESKDPNKEKPEDIIRKLLIRDNIDQKESSETNEENYATLDTISIGSESEQMEKLKIVLAGSFQEKLKDYPFLNNEQINNIMVGTISKIFNSGKLKEALSGGNGILSGFLKKSGMGEIVADFNGIKPLLDNSKELQTLLDDNLKDLKAALDANKTNPNNLSKLLSNPQAIEEFKAGDNILDIKKLSKEELTDYLVGINGKVLEFDKQLQQFSTIKEGIFSELSNAPEYIQEGTKKFLQLLFKIPFIGNLLAGVLGYSSGEEALEGFGDELDFAKSVNNLRDYAFINKESKLKEIPILKNKDLSTVSYGKLKPFFNTCKEAGIDYKSKDFWYKLLENKADQKSEKELSQISSKLNKDKIDSDDFKDNKVNDSFYQKLNNLSIKEEKKEEEQVPQENSTSEQLQGQVEEISGQIIKEDDFKEGSGKGSDFTKLDEGDLEDLKYDISLKDLLSSDYKGLIQAQVGSRFLPDSLNYDYISIEDYIESLRKKLQDLGNEKIKELADGKDLSKVKFEELINPDSDLFKAIYEKELSSQGEVEKRLKKQKEIEAIMSSISDVGGTLNSFTFENQGVSTEVSIDYNKGEIKIGDENFKIDIENGYSITAISKNGDQVKFEANIFGSSSEQAMKTITIDTRTFSNYIYNLKTNKGMDLKSSQGDKIGEIKPAK